MRGRIITIIFTVLLGISAAVEGVIVWKSVEDIPTVAEVSLPQSSSFLTEAYNQSSSTILTQLRDVDRAWQRKTVSRINSWLDEKKAQQEVEDTSEMESVRDELLVMQAVTQTVREVYARLQEEAATSPGTAVNVVGQMTALADALYSLGILEFSDDDFVVIEVIGESQVERAMNRNERTAKILSAVAAMGYIQFDADAFWKAVSAEQVLQGGGAAGGELRPPSYEDAEGDSQTAPEQGALGGDEEDEDTGGAQDPSGETPEESSSKVYHGQFKAVYVCTCPACYTEVYSGVNINDNLVWADENYISSGSVIELSTIPGFTFRVRTGDSIGVGRTIYVFCADHAYAGDAATGYPKVYIYIRIKESANK